jgi:hypothetical protein
VWARVRSADVAQLVEHSHGKGKVSGSIPDIGSKDPQASFVHINKKHRTGRFDAREGCGNGNDQRAESLRVRDA